MSEPLTCPVCRLSMPSIPIRVATHTDVCSAVCAWRWEHTVYANNEWCGELDPNMCGSNQWDEQ